VDLQNQPSAVSHNFGLIESRTPRRASPCNGVNFPEDMFCGFFSYPEFYKKPSSDTSCQNFGRGLMLIREGERSKRALMPV
jgi:hypothetical protein